MVSARSHLTVRLANDQMIASQSSVNEERQTYDSYFPNVCCKAENVLDGVYLVPRYLTEMTYLSNYSSGPKILFIDTKGPENINRVRLV